MSIYLSNLALKIERIQYAKSICQNTIYNSICKKFYLVQFLSYTVQIFMENCEGLTCIIETLDSLNMLTIASSHSDSYFSLA